MAFTVVNEFMSEMSILVVVLFIMLAFTIGLNLGLHGVILISWEHPFSRAAAAQAGTASSPSSASSASSSPATAPAQSAVTHLKPIAGVPPLTKAKQAADRDIEQFYSKKHGKTWSIVQDKMDRMLTTLSSSLTPIDLQAVNPYRASPVVLLAANRPVLLEATIQSLLAVHGVSKEGILVVQDGNAEDVAKVVAQHALQIVQHTHHLRIHDGGARIAQHYNFALTTAFDHFPDAQGIIIVEDDLLFAPDFHSYLTNAAYLLVADKSTFLVSAWNDNGFTGHVHDPYRLMRTDYFPGLGWLLPRKLYMEELKDQWPKEHWDHWMRSPSTHKGREIIYPQVPRSFHNGIKGTFMTQSTHNLYFKDIATNANSSLSWALDAQNPRSKEVAKQLALAQKSGYEQRIALWIKSCKHVHSVQEMLSMHGELLCVWINVDPNPDPPQPFGPASVFFHLWHEHRRANHRGLHEFYFQDNYVMLLNTFHGIDSYSAMKPDSVRTVVFGEKEVKLLEEHNRRRVNEQVVKADRPNQSCDEVCSAMGKHCSEADLNHINHCDVLSAHFSCSKCTGSLGAEQPAAIRKGDGYECLFNMDTKHLALSCAAKHPDTTRLCVCI